jgi:UDP-N-acetylglucosamine transferase subunit ALG13
VAPLDWGLGHAARCIPVIRELLVHDVEVFLGGSGISGELLRLEFPELNYEEIPGYDVSYSSTLPMAIAMLRQAPGILRSIQQEKKWLDEKLKRDELDAVISDHRYGLYHKNIYSVFMGHQLFISSGNNDLLEPLLWKVNRSYIENFNHCWIPDVPGASNASGKLAHKEPIPFSHQFIGLLSRFQPVLAGEKNYTMSFILSGPEPLRTELENLIIEQSYSLKEGKYMLIRGTQKPLQREPITNMEIIHLAESKAVEKVIHASHLLVSRAGYSSIMDYLVTGSRALLIPTPGQTEQQYLATYHLEGGNFYTVQQNKLDLINNHSLAETYQPLFANQPQLLELAVKHLIKSIN